MTLSKFALAGLLVLTGLAGIIAGKTLPMSHVGDENHGGHEGAASSQHAKTKSIPDASDHRQLVKLPEMMQAHMLSNMRDHLIALDEILTDLSKGEVDSAAQIAENRLGMSSLSLHGAAHMGKFMPKEMGQIGTSMHRAASRFVIIARNAELDPGIDKQRKVYKALGEITQNCNACHQAYRIR